MERNFPEILHDRQTEVVFIPETHLPKLPHIVDLDEFQAKKARLSDEALAACEASGTVGLRYVEHDLSVAAAYPANPNGSPAGITGLSSLDGRATIMMPHPERVFRTVQNSWAPAEWGEDAGWMRLFRNARHWLG